MSAKSAAAANVAGVGLFIVFEGGEGTGKSTHTKRLAAYLESQGRDVVVTREPGGTHLAEQVRALVLDPQNASLPDTAEALLFAAARADHAENLIKPALARGAVVLCDRYIDSSVAYQGVARGLGAQRIRDLSQWATGGLTPDLTIYMELPLETAHGRRDSDDRIESQSEEFHTSVIEGFRTIAKTNTLRHVVIDATQPKDDVELAIRNAVIPLVESL